MQEEEERLLESGTWQGTKCLLMKDLQKAANDPSRFHIVGDINRIGVNLFMVKLEYTHYPPRSGKNHLFDVRILKWPHDDFNFWAICSIPTEDRSLAERIIEECGLRLAHGTPIMLCGGKEHYFPMQGENVWSLENCHGHPIYNDRAAAEKLRGEHNREIETILENDNIKIRQELRDRGLNDAQIQRILFQWANGNEEYMENPL